MHRSNERDVSLRSEACFGDKWCFCPSCEAGTAVLLSAEIKLSVVGSDDYEHELLTMKHTWKAKAHQEVLPMKEVVDATLNGPWLNFAYGFVDLNASLDTWFRGYRCTDTKKD